MEFIGAHRKRRMERDADSAVQARDWTGRHGFTLRINNGGHHWMIQKGGFVAEWWPSSAKLVLQRDNLCNFRVFDWSGIIPYLPGQNQLPD